MKIRLDRSARVVQNLKHKRSYTKSPRENITKTITGNTFVAQMYASLEYHTYLHKNQSIDCLFSG